MNRPEGITESTWEKAKAAFQQCRDMEAKWSDGTGPEAIARAIQSAVEAEREALLNEVSTISGSLRHDDTPKTALSYVRAAIRKGA